MKNKFSVRLYELRKEKILTQGNLAEAISVCKRTISYLENGKRECDFDTLIKIANFFEVSTDYLLGLKDF